MTTTTSNFASTTVKGTFWTYASHYGGKFLVFISTIILARLLSQEDFGVVGFALVVISFLDVLSDLGVGPALIYYRDDPEAANTGFWLGLATGLGLFGLTWVVAPFAGTFFNDPRAISITRALGWTFPISALGNVHNSLLHKNLAFKRKFLPDMAKMGSKGIVSIVLALLNFGPWSLVGGQITGAIVLVIAYWLTIPWKPALRFTRSLVRPLLTYGFGIISLDALAILLSNADYLLVGRFMGAAALGVYTLAFRIPDLLIMQFCTVVGKVLFPVYAKMREDGNALRHAFLMTMRYVSMITIPIGVGLALIAEPFILTFFTDKWADAIPVMRAISIYALLYSLAYNAGSVYKAQGRPMLLTKLSFVRALILIPALWWAATTFGTIAAVGWTHSVVAFIGGMLNLIVAGRIINTPFKEIATTLRSAMVAGFVMALAVLGVLWLLDDASPLIQLIITVLTGGLVYGAVLLLLEQELRQHLQTARHKLARR